MKMAEIVGDLGCEVLIIGRTLGECCRNDLVPFPVKRFKMFFNSGFLFYAAFNLRLFFFLLFTRTDILVANDLDTLLPNFIVSRLRRLTLVYDSHEYFTGVPELIGRPFVKSFWKKIEKSIFTNLNNIITVSDSLADQYEKEYGVRALVVRNCSKRSQHLKGYSKKEIGISEKDFLLIIQGSGINADKGGEELIEAVRITENVSLLIVGSGDIIKDLREMVTTMDLGSRVRFVSKLPWEELMRYTKSADAGMCLEKDTNLNYRFSIPNKLCDYISAGIPVVAGNLPEIKKIVEEYRCGIIIPDITSFNISHAVIELRDNDKLRNELKTNSAAASEELNWENESRKVLSFYKNLLINTGH
jgi:glycosyltransferase involved in cell wall biosynthesis